MVTVDAGSPFAGGTENPQARIRIPSTPRCMRTLRLQILKRILRREAEFHAGGGLGNEDAERTWRGRGEEPERNQS